MSQGVNVVRESPLTNVHNATDFLGNNDSAEAVWTIMITTIKEYKNKAPYGDLFLYDHMPLYFTKKIWYSEENNKRGGYNMFADNLTQMANVPYSNEVNEIIYFAINELKKECTIIANKGGRSIETSLMGNDYDFGVFPLNFSNIHPLTPLKRIPENDLLLIFEIVKKRFAEELEKEGFKNIRLTVDKTGPFYPPKFIFGKASCFKDKSNPYYNTYIRISVSW